MPNRNLLTLLKNTVDKHAGKVCLRYKEDGRWQELTWREAYSRILDLAGGLRKLGVQKGDRVCIFAKTRYEWTLADMAILACGGVSVPIYESSLPEQAAFIINNSGARILFAENENQLGKIRKVLHELPNLKQIVLIETGPDFKKEDGLYLFDELLVLGSGSGADVFNHSVEKLKPEDEASFVYTSGTTGPPKGAILTHGNFISELESLNQFFAFAPDLESLLFLPLAHIFARVIQYAQIYTGFVQNYAESIDHLLTNLTEVKPHLMASVPRIFEKVHTRVVQGVESGSDLKKKIFNWAVEVGAKRAKYVNKGKSVPFGLKIQWALAYRLVFSKLHEKLGGRIRYFISGGAPLSREIGDFFEAAGFLILEGYGLTETSAAVTCNSPTAHKVGTVGKALPGVELKIAADGEILVRGEMVFGGYYQRDTESKEVLDKDGWFHTGDIGVIDDEGFLAITDRKKDIIVTAAGKNIAPQNIENLVKTDPYISQIMIHGDKRKFLSALVTLDQEKILSWAKENRISFSDYRELVRNDKLYQLIKQRLDDKNKQLAKYETIKKFAILDGDFSVETGELTPTLKIKRKFTSEKYKHIIEQFYQE